MLRVPGARKAVRAECEALVVETQPAVLTWWTHLPRPYAREMGGAGDSSPGPNDSQLGLDAAGRPVLQQSDHGSRGVATRWGDGWCEIVALGTGRPPHTHHFTFDGDRVVEEIEIEGRRADGEPGVGVTRWFYDADGRPELAVETYESQDRGIGADAAPVHWRGKLYRYTYDADGELEQVRWANSHERFAEGADVDVAQATARAGEATLFPALEPIYDARTQRLEHDLTAADAALEGVADRLTDTFHRALLPVLAAAGEVDLVRLHVRGGWPEATVVTSAFADRARRMGLEEESLDVLYRRPKGTITIEAVDVAGPDLLRRLRRGNQSLQSTGDDRAHGALGRDVAARLSALDWPGLASPPRFATPPAHSGAFILSDHLDAAEPPIEGPASRDQLRALLRNAGLDEAASGTLARDARWGLRIEPGGRGVSRLGGAPLLAPGTAWPQADGRPHTHLATIAFDELPAFEDRGLLPADGSLSFFADLSDEGRMYAVEPGDGQQDLVRFIATSASTPHTEIVPPGPALPEQRIRFVPVLELRSLGWGMGEHLLGLDALDELAVERLRERLASGFGHQLLGHPTPIQDDPRSPEQMTLLRVASDEAIAFTFQDGGDLHLFGAPGDIREGRWDRISVVGSSH